MGFNYLAVACPFLLPISYIWDVVSYWRIIFKYWASSGSGAARHVDKVAMVQEQVRARNGRQMCTARPSWMSISQQRLGYKDRMHRIRLDFLHDIVNVDSDKMEVSVEPNITIGYLNRALVRLGYTLPVVPELDNLTIGGLINGGGIESTSHKYGLFQHIATAYEIVLANGDVINVSKTHNSDYFYATAMSYGTLGFVTKVTLKIVEYKPFIKLTYRPCFSLDETIKCFSDQTMKDTENDSVEGIAFTKDTSVIMTGQFVGQESVDWSKVNRMGAWYKPWFYQYVRSFLQEGGKERVYVEYVPTLDFHQRHNKPCFWMSHIWLPWADQAWARYLLGWLLPMNYQLLSWLKETFIGDEFEDCFMLQDFILPLHHVKESLEMNDELTHIYPVWLVPSKLYFPDLPQSIKPHAGDVMYVDVGVYGNSPLPKYVGRTKALRAFERFTLEHQGYQALYAETLMPQNEFDEMFPRELYDKARAAYPETMEAFPEVYNKISSLARSSKSNQNNNDTRKMK